MGTVESDGLTELLSAFLDDEVDQRERAYVERILGADPNARMLLEELRTTSAALGELPRHNAPASIEEDVLNRLERSDLLADTAESHHVVSGRRSRYRAFVAMAAMIGLGVVGTMLYYSDWNDLKPRPSKRQASIVAKTEIAKPILDHANVEDKILKGVKLATLTSHPFGNETVRLLVSVGDRAERDSMSVRLMRRLAKRHVADLVDLDAADKDANERTSFYYRGRPSVNFDSKEQSQILVRVPASTLEELLDVMADDTHSTERITLAAGGLTFRGEGSARKTLRQLTGVSPQEEHFGLGKEVSDELRTDRFADATMRTNQPAKQSHSLQKSVGKGIFDDMLDAFGMPRDLLEQDPETESYTLGDPKSQRDMTVGQGILNFDKRGRALSVVGQAPARDASKLKKSDVASADKIASLEPKELSNTSASSDSRKSTGLVARRKEAMNQRRAHGAASPPATVAEKIEPKRAAKRKIKSLAKKTQSTLMGKTRQAKVDPLVTLVIQLMPVELKKQPASKPAASKKASAKAKESGKPISNNKSIKTKSKPGKPLG